MTTLISDLKNRPELFDLVGEIDEEELTEWLSSKGLDDIPDDLREIWSKTGGGEIFETETLLAPFGEPSIGDDLDGVNQIYHSKGMNPNFTVFHFGIGGLSVIDRVTQTYHQIYDDSFIIHSDFESFDCWYNQVLKSEYAKRYGL